MAEFNRKRKAGDITPGLAESASVSNEAGGGGCRGGGDECSSCYKPATFSQLILEGTRAIKLGHNKCTKPIVAQILSMFPEESFTNVPLELQAEILWAFVELHAPLTAHDAARFDSSLFFICAIHTAKDKATTAAYLRGITAERLKQCIRGGYFNEDSANEALAYAIEWFPTKYVMCVLSAFDQLGCSPSIDSIVIENAYDLGDRMFVLAMLSATRSTDWYPAAIARAAKLDRIDTIRDLMDTKSFVLTGEDANRAEEEAAFSGNAECLKLIIQLRKHDDPEDEENLCAHLIEKCASATCIEIILKSGRLAKKNCKRALKRAMWLARHNERYDCLKALGEFDPETRAELG